MYIYNILYIIYISIYYTIYYYIKYNTHSVPVALYIVYIEYIRYIKYTIIYYIPHYCDRVRFREN